jgi:hypothetical protein
VEDKKKLAAKAAAKAATEADKKKTVDADLQAIRKEDQKRYDVLITGEQLLKHQFSSEQDVRVNRNPLWLGKTIVDMRIAYFGVYKKLTPNSSDATKWNDYAGVRLNFTETGIPRASTFRYSDAYREAVKTFGEPVVTAIARHKRMIGVQVSAENCLGRFTKIAERLKKKVDATTPESIRAFVETVVNAPMEPKPSRTADEEKEAFHQTFMRYVRSILRKEKKTMNVVDARAVMLEEVRHLLHAFELKGEYKLTASEELPNDEYQTWAAFTKTAPASGSVMDETEHFGEYFGRHNPKNPHAASTPWELVSDADPKKLKPTGGYARNKPDATMAAKKLFEQSEAKAAHAAKKPKAEGAAAGATA